MAFVTTHQTDGITVMTIDRPPANALDLELLNELSGALERVAGDPPAALVLCGRPGCFSAGVDLKAVPAYEPADQRRMVHGINHMAISAYSLPCPVVAAITGHAIAGGMVLALCADHRVASTTGRYGLTEVTVGVPYPQAAIAVVRAELAPHAARTLALGGRLTDGQECVRLGVFDEALAAERVPERALEIAAELATLSRDVYATTKLGLRGSVTAAMRAAANADPLLETWVSS